MSIKNGLKINPNTTELFEKQVKKHPDEVAVIFGNDKLTYKELDKRSNQLAYFLRERGVQAETLVGFSINNCLDLIVGILGILKAGGVYLPLEPNYPYERIKYMFEDAKPSILLTESSLISKFTGFSGKVIQLDKSWEEISTFSDKSLGISVQSNHLAYVIYTSGSTGKPKGIMVEHSSFAHSSLAHRKFYSGKLIGLLTSAISFDVSILIIFHLLISGGTICIPPSGSTIDAVELVNLIEINSISYILCVPSLYSMILEKSRKLSSLKIVSLAGENVPSSLAVCHSQFAPNAILYNEYGPTECAIGSTITKIYDPVTRQINKITVGKPLPNTQVHILDQNLEPVPNGAKGEIFIGGIGLARGYLNKPELTVEKFLHVSLNGQLPTRLYRTGDIGRFLPNGDLEFLGRIDHQVKIRGYRIELGEIEYIICQYPEIKATAVVLYEENKQLVAYFSASSQVNIQALRLYLSNLLPAYMIPSSLIQLEQFSLTPNGKIDRQALLALPEPKIMSINFAEPQSELEQVILIIWKKVLKRNDIGIHDHFFEIGGDSLQVATVQTAVEDTLKLKVPIVDFFHYPTVCQLAQHLTSKEGSLSKVASSKNHAEKRRNAFQRFKRHNGLAHGAS